jgi:hypothetical protein
MRPTERPSLTRLQEKLILIGLTAHCGRHIFQADTVLVARTVRPPWVPWNSGFDGED